MEDHEREEEEMAEHFAERSERHFSTRDLWGYCDVNAAAQVDALTRLRDMAHGFPSILLDDPVNHDKEDSDRAFAEWKRILTVMIDGWQAMIDIEALTIRDYDPNLTFQQNLTTPIPEGAYECYRAACEACLERFKTGMALYVEYYQSLWD